MPQTAVEYYLSDQYPRNLPVLILAELLKSGVSTPGHPAAATLDAPAPRHAPARPSNATAFGGLFSDERLTPVATKKARKPAPIPMAHPSGTFITIQQVRALLGFKSDKPVREQIDTGVLPAYRVSNKPGAAIRILVDDVYRVLQPVIPPEVYADMRSRQPSPLHAPLPEGGAQ